ncbi:MAG: hypothetical protein ABI421_01580 [Polyangiaceae bacterium]
MSRVETANAAESRLEARQEDRRAMLTDGAISVGAQWASGWREAMRREGRAIAGGWPGTLPEARARVAAYFGAELARRRMPVMTTDELQVAVAATYEKARRDWLTHE